MLVLPAQLPTALPGGMSARFRVGTSLAAACKALGYAQELGYNNFLYPNESDARALLMWLVDRLPKESAAGAGADGDAVGAGSAVPTTSSAQLVSSARC